MMAFRRYSSKARLTRYHYKDQSNPGQRRECRLVAGMYSPSHRYSKTQSVVQKNPWANPGGTQIHSPWSASGSSEMSRATILPSVGDPSRISSARSTTRPRTALTSLPIWDSTNEAADHAGAGETLVDLQKPDLPEETGLRVMDEIAKTVGFREVTPLIGVPAETNDLQIGDRKGLHRIDLQPDLLSWTLIRGTR